MLHNVATHEPGNQVGEEPIWHEGKKVEPNQNRMRQLAHRGIRLFTELLEATSHLQRIHGDRLWENDA